MCAYLSDNDPIRFRITYFETEIGEGLYLYKCKREQENDKLASDTALKYKLTFMQMDWIAKCFTGTNPELLKNYELRLQEIEKKEDVKPKVRTQQEEDNTLAAFESHGYKIKQKF